MTASEAAAMFSAIALLAAWLVLGETLTLQQAGGAALAVAGVVLARRYARPREG